METDIGLILWNAIPSCAFFQVGCFVSRRVYNRSESWNLLLTRFILRPLTVSDLLSWAIKPRVEVGRRPGGFRNPRPRTSGLE